MSRFAKFSLPLVVLLSSVLQSYPAHAGWLFKEAEGAAETAAIEKSAGAIERRIFQHELPAAERSRQLHSALKAATQKRTTTAVTETKEGFRIISSSEKRLRPAQRRLLQAGEIEGQWVGHAEMTGINAAREMGYTPTGTAASRPICPACQQFLEKEHIHPLSTLKSMLKRGGG